MKPLDKRALEILADCEIGATLDALQTNCEIDPATLARVVGRGYARREVRTMANPKGLRVTWFFITAAGKAALKEKS
jgi:hypothetical protein